jgi:hypothetical protein
VNKNRVTDVIGLRLARPALRELKVRGIFAHSPVSLEHQHLARRYVVRGVESGGAVGDIGRYVTFTAEDGEPIDYLHPVETIGVNGIHAVVLAPVLVRVEMLRKGRTYELLISRHAAGKTENGQRPQLQTQVLFRGVHGRLELDLWGKDKAQAGAALPTFYSLAGEEIAIPDLFKPVVCAATKAVNCIGCSHGHYTRAPGADRTEGPRVPRRNRLATVSEPADSSAARASTALPSEVTGVAEAA